MRRAAALSQVLVFSSQAQQPRPGAFQVQDARLSRRRVFRQAPRTPVYHWRDQPSRSRPLTLERGIAGFASSGGMWRHGERGGRDEGERGTLRQDRSAACCVRGNSFRDFTGATMAEQSKVLPILPVSSAQQNLWKINTNMRRVSWVKLGLCAGRCREKTVCQCTSFSALPLRSCDFRAAVIPLVRGGAAKVDFFCCACTEKLRLSSRSSLHTFLSTLVLLQLPSWSCRMKRGAAQKHTKRHALHNVFLYKRVAKEPSGRIHLKVAGARLRCWAEPLPLPRDL